MLPMRNRYRVPYFLWYYFKVLKYSFYVFNNLFLKNSPLLSVYRLQYIELRLEQELELEPK